MKTDSGQQGGTPYLKAALFIALALPLFLFAETNPSALQKLIAELQAKIQSLQEQVATLKTELEKSRKDVETVRAERIFTKMLSRGARGDEVKELQKFLSRFPDVYPEKLITGYFGPRTEEAVRRLQAQTGLESLGIVGPRTQAKINELLASGAGSGGIAPRGFLTAPGIEGQRATSTPPASLEPRGRAITFASPTTTPSGIIPAVPAQPIGQTGTTTIPATPATPVVSPPPTGGLPPPPSQTPPPPPGTVTTTPPATLPPPPVTPPPTALTPPPPPPSQTFPPPPPVTFPPPPVAPPPPPPTANLPAPTALKPGFTLGYNVYNWGKINDSISFNYDSSKLSQVSAFRLYQKQPGESVFSVAAEFSDPSSLTSCSSSKRASGTWYLAPIWGSSCPNSAWSIGRTVDLQSVSNFAAGDYFYYITALEASGNEGSPSATGKRTFLESFSIQSPTAGGSPTSLTPTFQWPVVSGWPRTPSYWISIAPSDSTGGPIWQAALSVSGSTGSKVYDGPALDPAKQYKVYIYGHSHNSDQSEDQSSFAVSTETFWVAPPPPPPQPKKITIAYPNGGEQFTKGQTHQIQWTHPLSSGFSGDGNLNWNINLDRVGNTGWYITSVPVTQSSYQWTINTTPSDFAPTGSNYKIRIFLSQGCYYTPCPNPSDLLPDGTSDSSDGTFTITNSSAFLPAPTLASVLHSLGIALDDLQKQIQKLVR